MCTKQSLSLIALVSALALCASSVAALGATGDTQGKSREQPGRAKKDKQEDKKDGQADERGGQKNGKIEKKGDIVVIDRDGHLRAVRETPVGRFRRRGWPS